MAASEPTIKNIGFYQVNNHVSRISTNSYVVHRQTLSEPAGLFSDRTCDTHSVSHTQGTVPSAAIIFKMIKVLEISSAGTL